MSSFSNVDPVDEYGYVLALLSFIVFKPMTMCLIFHPNLTLNFLTPPANNNFNQRPTLPSAPVTVSGKTHSSHTQGDA